MSILIWTSKAVIWKNVLKNLPWTSLTKGPFQHCFQWDIPNNRTVNGHAVVDTVLKCTVENHSCTEALKHSSPISHSTRAIIQTTAHRIFFCSVFNLVQYFSTFSLQNNYCLGLQTLTLIYCASWSISGPFKGIPRATGYKKVNCTLAVTMKHALLRGQWGCTSTWFLPLSKSIGEKRCLSQFHREVPPFWKSHNSTYDRLHPLLFWLFVIHAPGADFGICIEGYSFVCLYIFLSLSGPI